MSSATVPKASVNKHGYAQCGECKIRASDKLRTSAPSYDTQRAKIGNESKLCAPITEAAYRGHNSGSAFMRKGVGHRSSGGSSLKENGDRTISRW